ncbi:MAG: dolichol-phosphate mannosyltransferase [Chloroflexota bacterium]|nr:dolichol-phosphate mannosyltransferase [Chloroflexota bacterium]
MTTASSRDGSTTQPDPGPAPEPAGATGIAVGAGAWIVLPTYNEADNLGSIVAAILAAAPGATLLVVDDGSPDGTGRLADELAAADPRIRVRHRPAKQGLGRAYLDGFGIALAGGARFVVQMDADWSHDPMALEGLLRPVNDGVADLVIGSRYTPGGGVVDWGVGRRLISRGGSLFARLVLGLRVHDLTGGFKAWRSTTLAAIPFAGIHAGGYVFQIEMTFRASRFGARVVEVPITFRDRRVGQSKMSRRIVFEALIVVVQLRAEELLGRVRGPRPAIELEQSAPPRTAPDDGATADGSTSPVERVEPAETVAAPGASPTSDASPTSAAAAAPTIQPGSAGR